MILPCLINLCKSIQNYLQQLYIPATSQTTIKPTSYNAVYLINHTRFSPTFYPILFNLLQSFSFLQSIVIYFNIIIKLYILLISIDHVYIVYIIYIYNMYIRKDPTVYNYILRVFSTRYSKAVWSILFSLTIFIT